MKYLLPFCLIILSCNNRPESTIELTFTSRNNDNITEIKSFYLTNIDEKIKEFKIQSFQNIECDKPNKFIVKKVNPGLYFALIQVVNASGIYNISYDSVLVKPGITYLEKEINLGKVKL